MPELKEINHKGTKLVFRTEFEKLLKKSWATAKKKVPGAGKDKKHIFTVNVDGTPHKVVVKETEFKDFELLNHLYENGVSVITPLGYVGKSNEGFMYSLLKEDAKHFSTIRDWMVKDKKALISSMAKEIAKMHNNNVIAHDLEFNLLISVPEEKAIIQDFDDAEYIIPGRKKLERPSTLFLDKSLTKAKRKIIDNFCGVVADALTANWIGSTEELNYLLKEYQRNSNLLNFWDFWNLKFQLRNKVEEVKSMGLIT